LGRRPFPAEAMFASSWVLLRDLLLLFLAIWSFLMTAGSVSSLVRMQCASLS
jgi:hypothetical protein